jgi:hypothetical protein
MENSGIQAARPAGKETGSDRDLEVNVIFTDRRSTVLALRKAEELAASLRARIRILLPSVVPRPLLLEEPPVDKEHHRKLLQDLMNESAAPGSALIVYCRDYADVVRVLPPESLVVMGTVANRWGTGSLFGRSGARWSGPGIIRSS